MSSAAKNSDTAAAAASGGTATAHGEEEEETHDKLMLFINTLDYLKVYLAEEGLDKPPKILDILRVRVMRNACIRDDDDYIHWRNRVFLPPPPPPPLFGQEQTAGRLRHCSRPTPTSSRAVRLRQAEEEDQGGKKRRNSQGRSGRKSIAQSGERQD